MATQGDNPRPEPVIHYAVGQCAMGGLLVAASHRGVCAILLGDDAAALIGNLRQRFPGTRLIDGLIDGLTEGDGAMDVLLARVIRLADAPAATMDLALDIRGTPFQHRVWQALGEIPPGRTASYGEIAERIGSPRAVRAVAGACAANALAIAIPCHRVVRRDGGLSGYRWGVERKRALLENERNAHGNGAPPAD